MAICSKTEKQNLLSIHTFVRAFGVQLCSVLHFSLSVEFPTIVSANGFFYPREMSSRTESSETYNFTRNQVMMSFREESTSIYCAENV